jgi:tetratricopeptide (TPR) repeat protein
MKNSTIGFLVLLLACSIFDLAIPRVSLGQGRSLDSALNKADTLVRAGRYPEGLAEAQVAIRLDPTQFKGYYYAAFALYKQGKLDDAERYVQDSLARAPDADKKDVQRLVDAIEQHREIEGKVRVGDDAMTSGLFAKAAEAYTDAWKISPDLAEDVGLKAAHLWGERISDPVRAVAIVNYIIAHPQDPTHLEDARRLLANLQGPLQAVYLSYYNRAVALANNGQYSDAIPLFKAALDAQPQEKSARWELANAYYRSDGYDEATQELVALSQSGATAAEVMSNVNWTNSLFHLVEDQGYSTTIQEAFGPIVIEQAQRLVADEVARQQALIAEENARKAASDLAAANKRAADDRLAEAKREAQERLPSTLSRLRVLLNVDIKYPNGGHVVRKIISDDNCTIVYDRIKPWHLHEIFPLGQINANPDLSNDLSFNISCRGPRSCIQEVDVKSGNTDWSVIAYGLGGRTAPERDEIINLFTDASLACTK